YRAIVITAGSAVLTAGGIVFGVAWFELGGDISEYLPRAVSMVIFWEGTFGWRVEYWQDYLDGYSQGPVLDQLIGQPFGVPRLAGARESYLSYGAHSEYVQLLLNGGAIGFLLFASVLAYALSKGAALLLAGAKGFNRPRNVALAVAIICSH